MGSTKNWQNPEVYNETQCFVYITILFLVLQFVIIIIVYPYSGHMRLDKCTIKVLHEITLLLQYFFPNAIRKQFGESFVECVSMVGCALWE